MKYILKLCLFLGLCTSSPMASVVVSCKPIYLVVAPLLKGVETPKLLISQGQCGHYHHLRPSEVQLLKSAKLVLWNGEVHEPFMSKLIANSTHNVKVFEEKDGFLWLSPLEVIKRLPKVITALKSVFPECDHAKIDSNAQKFISELEGLHAKNLRQLEKLKGRSILTTYPMLTYFAKEYGLVVAGYMTGSPEESMTPQKLRNIYKALEDKKVIGVVKDHHIPLSVIQSLVQKYKTPVLTVDAEGIDIPLSMQGYYILIERLTQSIVKWAE
jgi:ABC-type Zn2+ transport system substrate-binding protein/surface adhesin